MTKRNGTTRAVLYARATTDEQATRGYSLAQRLEALRDYAAREGYEVLEEVVDPGQSWASLERPGMDRVRDLVDEGGVSVVLAQDRDRLARKVVLNLVLEEGFAQHGCRLQALNDYAGDGPEAALMRGIQGQFAEYERAYSIFEYWSLVDLAATLLVGGIAPAILWMEHGENRVRPAGFVIRLCTGTA